MRAQARAYRIYTKTEERARNLDGAHSEPRCGGDGERKGRAAERIRKWDRKVDCRALDAAMVCDGAGKEQRTRGDMP